jgi:hypothetical protein
MYTIKNAIIIAIIQANGFQKPTPNASLPVLNEENHCSINRDI